MIPATTHSTGPGSLLSGLFLLAAMRPHLLLPAWAAAATGAALAHGTPAEAAPAPNLAASAPGLATWSLTLLAVHLINHIGDSETDRINAKNQAVRSRLNTLQLAAAAGVLGAAGLGAAWLARPDLLLPVTATLLLGCAYSLAPVRLCARPGADLLVHLLGYAVLAPWIGATLATGLAARSLSLPVPAVEVPVAAVEYLAPVVGAVFLLTALLDLPGDRATGKHTSAVWLVAHWPGLGFWVGTPAGRRVVLGFVFAGVLVAGLPGLVRWPELVWYLAAGAALGYGLQWVAGRVGRDGE